MLPDLPIYRQINELTIANYIIMWQDLWKDTRRVFTLINHNSLYKWVVDLKWFWTSYILKLITLSYVAKWVAISYKWFLTWPGFCINTFYIIFTYVFICLRVLNPCVYLGPAGVNMNPVFMWINTLHLFL